MPRFRVRATPEDDLTCRELVELVTDYFEDALPAAERRRFEAHVSTCEGCQAHLEQMRRTMELLGALCEENVPPEARDGLLQTFRDWKRGAA
jgi:anti-sigma factor RsiW